jgi:cytidyltransferase-like protein
MSLSENPLDRFIAAGGVLHVASDGQMLPSDSEGGPTVHALLPGSFDPFHQGHRSLAQVAAEIIGKPVAFELSVVNVDKPQLTADEVRRRLMPFNGHASVWLTHAARFVDKADAFPHTTFVVGADTALRIVLPRYYGDEVRMLAALVHLRERACRFLVACRVNMQGNCLTLDDIPIPAGFGDLFEEIPAGRFRMDISSTALRQSESANVTPTTR